MVSTSWVRGFFAGPTGVGLLGGEVSLDAKERICRLLFARVNVIREIGRGVLVRNRDNGLAV